ncbi:metacaspase-1-like isoform X2 [Juglans regia]|uniref:Metacaspase-1-like isoform X2 n=1 Tax=Juglans regia TaxID=51240 RepID=A0A2I4EMB0_JUGRE|nr:metacaspase-1-like isoform X2 [Juglans regia]XP_035540032.1 metacaspase-1-like isoform X2 [Juglans regia]
MDGKSVVICNRCNKRYSVAKYAAIIRCTECKAIIPGPASMELGNQIRHALSKTKSNLHQYSFGNGGKLLKSTRPSSSSTNVSSLDTKPPYPTGNSGEAHGMKRALLCGVTYQNKKYSLKGTVNDVRRMKNLLMQRFGYRRDCIRILTEDQVDSDFMPTKKNIQDSLKWLVEGSESGDSLVFYFSGHGLRQPDFNDDEKDGFDETICPVDFMQEGMILDNEINSTIVRPLKKGITLHAIVDACHSGTVLDLEYIYDPHNDIWNDNKPPSKADKSTSGGLAICLSACGDDQMASDTSAFTGKEMTGAMTFILIHIVENVPEITYGGLLNQMHACIEQVNNKRCLSVPCLRKLFGRRKIENPMLSSSQEFPVYSKKFLL